MKTIILTEWERRQLVRFCSDIAKDGLNLPGDERWRALLKKLRSRKSVTNANA